MVSLNILSTRYQANHAVVIVHQMEKVMYIGYHVTANQSKFVSDSVQQGRGLLAIYFSERKTSSPPSLSVNNKDHPNNGVINKFNHGATIGA